ncbi:MAG: AMP-binding protein [Polaromonas sp.]
MSGADLFFEGQVVDAATQAARGEQLAGGLQRLGLREGDVLGVLLRNSALWADVVHACRKAGVYFCPINWHFTADEVSWLLQDSGAKALIADGDLLDAVEHRVPEHVRLLANGESQTSRALGYETWLADQAPYDGPVVSPRGHMPYTSGTTGRPKGVVRLPMPVDELVERQARVKQVVERAFGLRAGCRALIPAPLYHSGPCMFLQGALETAERVVLMARFDAEQLLAAIATHRIDTAYLVPIMMVRLLRLPVQVRQRYDVSSLRFVVSTGAPCAPDVKRAMIEWFGPVIHETYAASEIGMITVIDSTEALARPGSTGRAVLDAQIRILDEQGASCAMGETGLIYARQPAYPDFTYRHNDAARREVERDGLISVGDMGYLDADGYLYVCDRASDMVISGGVNIYPAEIEHRLLAFPGVTDCAVFGVPDAEFGERLHAMVEVEPGVAPALEQMRDFLKATLSSFKVPRSIEITTLPRDDNGKIAKRRLREAHWKDQTRRV